MEKTHVAIMPSGVVLEEGSERRFLRLPHPRSSQPTLFLPSQPTASTSALLEVQQIKPDPSLARSWFIDQNVVADGALTIMTPVDPVYLLITLLNSLPPALLANYATQQDVWEALAESCDDVLPFSKLDCVQKRLEAICDTQDYAGQTLIRFSEPKALLLLRAKVDALTAPGSLFGAYEATDLAAATEIVMDPKPFPTVSRGLTREGAGDGKGCDEALQLETRQKSALAVLGNYLNAKTLDSLSTSYSFPLLASYLAAHTSSASVLATTYLPGRKNGEAGAGSAGGGGFGAAAAERDKKRKAEAAKKSRGVKELAKASTKGMATLESMFGKRKSPRKK